MHRLISLILFGGLVGRNHAPSVRLPAGAQGGARFLFDGEDAGLRPAAGVSNPADVREAPAPAATWAVWKGWGRIPLTRSDCVTPYSHTVY